MNVVHDYQPRPHFMPFHLRKQRWAILVAHRRAGKTVATINDCISRSYYSQRSDARYAYVAPFYGQAKRIAWTYLKSYARSGVSKVSESDLTVTIRHNQAQITLYGADNPDTFRGLYFDGVILDEYGNMRPSVWSEVLLPTLVDRRGWAVFIGTPNGPNHFRDLFHRAQKDPDNWFSELLPVSQTNLIDTDELAEMQRLMLPEEYLQEMECSFEASTRGAFYSQEITDAHVGAYPADPVLPLHFVFDIGRTDDTAMGAFQETSLTTNIVCAEAENMRGPQYWIKRINETCATHNTSRGVVWLPHDAKAKTWATERSGVEQFVDSGIRPQMVPTLGVLDGINAARFIFQYVTFNDPYTDQLILALKSYHRKYDEDKKAFSNEAEHNWASHYADMFRYFAIVAKFPHSRPLHIPPVLPNPKILTNYPFTLNDLWEQQNGQRHNNIR